MFRPRCAYHELVPGNRCDTDRPDLRPVTPEHAVRCHLEPAQRQEIAAERLFARGGNVAGGGADPDNPTARDRTDTASRDSYRRRRRSDRRRREGPYQGARREDALLRVTEVQKYFPITGGGVLKRKVGDVKAVESISFDIVPGETARASSGSPAAASRPPGAR